MEDLQKDGPWLLVPGDGSLVRSVDPVSLPHRLPGRVVQVCYSRENRRLSVRECRALISKAAMWDTMDNAARQDMLLTDAATYADLARAHARVIEVKRNV